MRFSHPVAVFESLPVLSCILIVEKFRNFGKEKSILSILKKKESSTGKIVMQLHFLDYGEENLYFLILHLVRKNFVLLQE